MAFDPALYAIWKPKSASGSYPTYRVNITGHYFVAYPASSFSFQSGGTKFVWGTSTYTKQLGDPSELVGIWTGDTDGEEWNFRADGTVTVHFSETEEYFGNYELRDGDTNLWYEEFRSLISTTGGRISFDPPYGLEKVYDYTLAGNFWSLFETTTGTLVFNYEKV